MASTVRLLVVSAPLGLLVACGGRSNAVEPTPVDCDRSNVHLGAVTAHSDEDLEPLRGVTEISGALWLTGRTTDLSPLGCLTRVEGDLELDAAAVTSVDGLGALAEVGGKVTISDLPLLTTFRGLGSLREIIWLEIDHNSSLVDLSGLEQVSLIASDITLSSNQALASLRGLEGLTRVGGNVVIMDNPSLPTCETDRLIAGVSIGGFAAISGNDDAGVCP